MILSELVSKIVLRHLTLSYVVLRRLTLSYGALRHLTSSYVILLLLTSYYVIFCRLTSSYVVLRHLTSSYVSLRHLTSYTASLVVLRHLTSSYVFLRDLTSWRQFSYFVVFIRRCSQVSLICNFSLVFSDLSTGVYLPQPEVACLQLCHRHHGRRGLVGGQNVARPYVSTRPAFGVRVPIPASTNFSIVGQSHLLGTNNNSPAKVRFE